jgi:hypothetical protein
MKNFTFQTTNGVVTLKPSHFNWRVNAYVVELKLTPPNLWGWGVTATLPEDMEDKVTQEFAEAWASDAIEKLAVPA